MVPAPPLCSGNPGSYEDLPALFRCNAAQEDAVRVRGLRWRVAVTRRAVNGISLWSCAGVGSDGARKTGRAHCTS